MVRNIQLQSVKITEEKGSESKNKIIQGLKAASYEASGVWILAIIFGMSMSMLGYNTENFADLFVNRSGFTSVILPLFIFAIVSFMISTIDGLVSAISYVAYFDLNNIKVHDTTHFEEKSKTISFRKARLTTLLSLILVYILYSLLKNLSGKTGFDAIEITLYAVYAVQSSIVLVIFLAFFKREYLNYKVAIISIIIGWFTAILVSTSDPIFGIHINSWAVIQPLAVLVTSSFPHLFFILYIKLKKRFF